MRLGQLARKLNLRPAEIVEFLAGNQIVIEGGSNSRLDDSYVQRIVEQFAPSRLLEVTEDITLKEDPNGEEFPTKEPEAPGDKPLSEAEAAGKSDEIIGIKNETPEVIKAPKVELPGLKVLGKIEFPEPKKKDPPPVEGVSPGGGSAGPELEKKPPREPRKTSSSRTNRRDERKGSNPIALERERQAQEAEKKKRAEAERKKELRKEHYFKKVKAPSPTKALKLMNEPVEVMTSEKANPPKSGLGRLLRWLRS